MCVPELLLPHKIIRMFGPEMAIFAPKYAFFGTYRPCRLIWCPGCCLIGGCGARAVSHKTPIYLIASKNVVTDLFDNMSGKKRGKPRKDQKKCPHKAH